MASEIGEHQRAYGVEAEKKPAEDGHLLGDLAHRVSEVPIVLPVGAKKVCIRAGRKSLQRNGVDTRVCSRRPQKQ